MFEALVVLWLGSEPELASRRSDIAGWAHSRKQHAKLLRPAAASYDAVLADQIEALLEEARSLPPAPETPTALVSAERLLLEHPELPQAAWLLAERYAIEAHTLVAAEEATDGRRSELDERSRALEGARAASAGAVQVLAAAAPQALVPAPNGARPRDRVFIDGMALAAQAAPMLLAPGRHHARLVRGGLPVWSGWVTLERGPAEALPDASPPCSGLDLADVGDGGTAPAPAPGVRCELWAVARPSPGGGVEVAECTGSRCNPWHHAGPTRLALAPSALDTAVPERSAWPSWMTWGLIGAGALAATGVVLWQAGVFERETPGTEFVFTGPSALAYHF